MKIQIDLLKPNLLNEKIYGEENVDDLVLSIGESGWIRPLAVTQDLIIVSGHRRWKAALKLGYVELPVEDEYVCDEQVSERLLRENENRLKTPEQQIREGMAWEDIETNKAKDRMKATQNNDAASSYENIYIPGGVGATRDIIARRVGLGTGVTYEKGKAVVERIDAYVRVGSLKEARMLALTLNEQSISAAKRLLDTMDAAQQEAADQKKQMIALLQQQLAASVGASGKPPKICHASYEDWLAQYGQCDLLLTDPPYMTDVPDIALFAQSWLPLALSHVKSTGRAYVCVGAYPEELRAYLNIEIPDWPLKQVLVWSYRNTDGGTPDAYYKPNWQAILYYVGVDAPPLNVWDREKPNEWYAAKEINAPDGRISGRFHMWEKPLELAEEFVRRGSAPGDVVHDCFAGTGTFLLAAAKLGRIALGCDTSLDMLHIAESRGCLWLKK